MTKSNLPKDKKEKEIDVPIPEVVINGMSESDLQVIEQCVTHSFKYTNSNAGIGGVRVSSTDHIDLPLLCSKTVNKKELIFADYQKNSKVTPVTMPIRDILNISIEIDEEVYDEKKEKIVTKKKKVIERVPDLKEAYLEMLKTGFQSVVEELNPRLRQVLLPMIFDNQKTQYVSVVPLSCGGLSKLVIDEVKKHNFTPVTEREGRFIQLSELGFGGSNAQNSGYLLKLGGILSQIYTASPSIGHDLKGLYLAHYNGLELFVENSDVNALCEHLLRGNKKETVGFKLKKTSLLQSLVSPVLSKAGLLYGSLQMHINELPNKAIFDEQLSSFQKSLISGKDRDGQWKELFCKEMAKVTEAKLKKLGLPSFNSNYYDTLEHVIKKAVF